MKLNSITIERLKRDYGNWILITGATSGIGRELALTLGKAGFNLVITGRREEFLNRIKTKLNQISESEVFCVPGDLSEENDVIDLIDKTDHLNINIAILNAGYGTSGKFLNSNIVNEVNMLDLNCKALLILTHHFAKKMKAHHQRGAIVLLSSMVAFQGVPNAANYAASKAYVQSLGEALHVELKSDGIDVLCAAPGPVETGFSARANMNMSRSLNPSDVALSIIKSIGIKSTVFPGFMTKFLVSNLRMTPRWGKIRIMGNVMKGFTKHQ